MSGRALVRGGLLLLAILLLSPSEAQAKIVLITHGDSISPLGDIAPEHRRPGVPHKIGFKYSYFGIFWIDLWTWSGEYCVYEEKRYGPLPRAQAAQLLKVPESQLHSPFLYRFPLGLILLTPLVVLGILGAVFGKKEPEPLIQLFRDPRYQKALEIMSAHGGKEQPAEPAPAEGEADKEKEQAKISAAFEAGIQHLVSQGVPREDAEQNLALMVQALASDPVPEASPPPAARS